PSPGPASVSLPRCSRRRSWSAADRGPVGSSGSATAPAHPSLASRSHSTSPVSSAVPFYLLSSNESHIPGVPQQLTGLLISILEQCLCQAVLGLNAIDRGLLPARSVAEQQQAAHSAARAGRQRPMPERAVTHHAA